MKIEDRSIVPGVLISKGNEVNFELRLIKVISNKVRVMRKCRRKRHYRRIGYINRSGVFKVTMIAPKETIIQNEIEDHSAHSSSSSTVVKKKSVSKRSKSDIL